MITFFIINLIIFLLCLNYFVKNNWDIEEKFKKSIIPLIGLLWGGIITIIYVCGFIITYLP
jgi:hypothetical protein